MNNNYNFHNIEVYKKGFLKGYAAGYITFNYNNKTYDHEFLFRFDDEANGKNYTMVSVDYGYKIPYINEVWQELEQYLTDYVNNHLAA